MHNVDAVKHAVRPRLYLVRHGQTAWNAAGRLLSRTDEPMDAMGETQATALGNQLRSVAWDSVRVSPRIRAGRTAELLLAAAGRSGLEVHVDDRLAELDFGPYEGWTERQLADDPVASRRRRDGTELPGMEPAESVAERASEVWADLSSLPGNTLVVGHGRMLRALIVLKVLGAPASAVSALRLRHCRPTIIEPGKRPLLLGLNVGDPADEALARQLS